MLANLIASYCAELAASGDWDKVAEILNAKTVRVSLGRVGGKASLSALVNARIDPNPVIAAMRADPMAGELMDTLVVSGVDWDDTLTRYVVGRLVAAGKITQQVADILKALSVRDEPVAGSVVNAEQCKAAYEDAAKQAEEIRDAARLAAQANALQTLTPQTVLSDKPETLDVVCGRIRAALEAFGAWE